MSDTTLEHLDPNALIIADNVRLDPKLDRGLIASIKARGVLTTIDAWRDTDGVHVLRGQRRTLAARQAGVATVPVAVSATRPDEADRLVDQWVENEHRAELSNRERIDAIEQMTLVGLSEAQIAKRTGTKRESVKAAITAASSETSRQAADTLTLEQAAALAEFDGDDEAVAQLLLAAEDGSFDHELSQQRQARIEREALAAVVEQLRADGLAVVEEYPKRYEPDGPQQLSDLVDGDDQADIDDEEHKSCPGHAYWPHMQSVYVYNDADGNRLDKEQARDLAEAWCREHASDSGHEEIETIDGFRALGITRDWVHEPTVTPVCTEPSRHRPRYSYERAAERKSVAEMTDEEREAARVERQQVITNNKAWRAAEEVRRAWLASFATRKTPPKGSETYVATHALGYVSATCTQRTDVIGLTREGLRAELESCTPKRALQIALIVALAEWEASTSIDTWRRPSDVDRRTLRQLGEWGYNLSEIESELANGD